MGENSNATTALSRLTPDLAIEVRRNLTVWMSVVLACFAIISGVLAVAVDPGLSEATGSIAGIMFGASLFRLLPFAGLLLAMVYLFDCWPAMLRGRFLRERCGVKPKELDNAAWWRAMCTGEFWVAAGRGAIVGWAFLSAAGLAEWGITGKSSFSGLSLMLIGLAMQISTRSSFVRQKVSRAELPVSYPQGLETSVASATADR
jgi:hypothetical protein